MYLREYSVCAGVQVFVLGGSWTALGGTKNDKGAELWDPSAVTTSKRSDWRYLNVIKGADIETNDPEGRYRADNYGWFFGWSDGYGAEHAKHPWTLCVTTLANTLQHCLLQCFHYLADCSYLSMVSVLPVQMMLDLNGFTVLQAQRGIKVQAVCSVSCGSKRGHALV
jgi:hypothetical protein